MTTNTVSHQCDYARVARRYRRAFQVHQNSQKSLRTMPAAGTIDQKWCTSTPDLEGGGQYVNVTASINPIWGMSVKIFLTFVFIAFPMPVNAQDGFAILLKKDSWTVLKFDGLIQGRHLAYCSAKSATNTGIFELIGEKERSCLSAESTNWKFRKRKSEVGFMVGDSGFFAPGNYYSNVLQICGSNETTHPLVDYLSSLSGATIDVYNDQKKNIGAFPASNMSAVVKKWKSCINGL